MVTSFSNSCLTGESTWFLLWLHSIEWKWSLNLKSIVDIHLKAIVEFTNSACRCTIFRCWCPIFVDVQTWGFASFSFEVGLGGLLLTIHAGISGAGNLFSCYLHLLARLNPTGYQCCCCNLSWWGCDETRTWHVVDSIGSVSKEFAGEWLCWLGTILFCCNKHMQWYFSSIILPFLLWSFPILIGRLFPVGKNYLRCAEQIHDDVEENEKKPL